MEVMERLAWVLCPSEAVVFRSRLPSVLSLEHVKGLQVYGIETSILSCPAPYLLRIWVWQSRSIHVCKPPSATNLPLFAFPALTTHLRSLSLTAGCGSSAEGAGQEPERVHWKPLCVAEGPGQLSQLQAPESPERAHPEPVSAWLVPHPSAQRRTF